MNRNVCAPAQAGALRAGLLPSQERKEGLHA
jgi:hypothetical protein